MDLTNRGQQPQSYQPSDSAAPQPPRNKFDDLKGRRPTSRGISFFRITNSAMLVVGLLLLIAVVGLLFTIKPENQQKYVKTNELQAVFLNTGQVYFGNVRNINKQYFVLSNIYYLQTSSADATKTTNSNVSLVKLGCELHQPFDQMIINRDQITFWENLQDNGQVAKAVVAFQKQNPSGQKCSDQTNASNPANVQGNAATPTTPVTPTTTTTPTTIKKP